MANITDVDRVKRLHIIDKLSEEGMSDSKISEELGMSLMAVKRGQKYLENLRQADLTPEILSEKRSELYLELVEATDEAKLLFERFKNPIECKYCKGTGEVLQKDSEELSVCSKCKGQGFVLYSVDAERFLKAWVDIIERKAKLFGLDNIKTENTFQQFNFNDKRYTPEIKITKEASRMSKDLIKKIKYDHEGKAKKRHEESGD